MDMRRVHLGLTVVAMLAALANYEGLSLVMGASTIWEHGFCAAIAFGVYTSISVFWHVVFAVVPQMEDWRFRVGTWVTTALGAVFILGISAYWSVASLGGPTTMQAIYEGVIAEAEHKLAASKAASGQFQKLMPPVEALDSDLGAMEKCESKGCLTSGVGAGGVSSLLGQLRDRATNILSTARNSRAKLDDMSNKAAACLADMRRAIAASGSMHAREEELARQVDCFNGALADMGNVEGAGGIVQALDGFTAGVVVPVAVKSINQKAAANSVLDGLKERTAGLAQSARAAITETPYTPIVMVRTNAMVAVARMWKTIIPAWATAICLDLAPLALLLLIAQKAAADRMKPDDSHLDRPIRDILLVRRAMTDLEPSPTQTDPPKLPQRRPTARGMQV